MRRSRILVVDDYVPVAHAIAQLLRLSGHAVMTAFAADEVMNTARAFQPEVVLLDIGLRGEHDGVAVASWLRHDAVFDDTLLVALSGRCDGEDDDRIAMAGFDYHLIKPVSFDELEAIIETAPARSVEGPKGNSIAG
ncbi:MAG TPA: response regulator [Gemmatimonadaceae bacterium]